MLEELLILQTALDALHISSSWVAIFDSCSSLAPRYWHLIPADSLLGAMHALKHECYQYGYGLPPLESGRYAPEWRNWGNEDARL